MIALVPSGLAALSAVALAVAGLAGGWIVAAAAGLCVLGLALGWGDLLRLPHKPGTTILIGALGVAGLAVGTLAGATSSTASTGGTGGTGTVGTDGALPPPLAMFAAVIAVCLLTSFAHELLRRDGRADVVESVTGTLTGQVIAVLASGWVLLVYTRPGSSAIVVAAAAVAGARIASGLPFPGPIEVMRWAGVGVGVVTGLVSSFFVPGVPPVNAVVVGLAVAGVGIAVDRLFEPVHDRPPGLSLLARAAAPVAAAGTVAYAVIRVGLG